MNTGIITSFVVGGILLLAILAMNMSISRSSSSLTMRQITQQRANGIAELLTYDIPKIGYPKYTAISNAKAIPVADSNKIEFQGDIDDDGSQEDVQWIFDDAGAAPGDNILYRIVDGDQTQIKTGVVTFKLTYYNSNGNPLPYPANPGDIRQIKVDLVVSSKEKLGKIGSGGGEYVRSPWQKTYTPKNLPN